MRGRLVRNSANNETELPLGAAVVRSHPNGSVLLEFGPADGPPTITLELSQDEATRLAAALREVAVDGGEDVLLNDT